MEISAAEPHPFTKHNARYGGGEVVGRGEGAVIGIRQVAVRGLAIEIIPTFR